MDLLTLTVLAGHNRVVFASKRKAHARCLLEALRGARPEFEADYLEGGRELCLARNQERCFHCQQLLWPKPHDLLQRPRWQRAAETAAPVWIDRLDHHGWIIDFESYDPYKQFAESIYRK